MEVALVDVAHHGADRLPPTEIDAVTGQRIADQVDAALAAVARNPESVVEPYEYTDAQWQRAGTAHPTPDEVHANKRAVLHGAVAGHPDLLVPSGYVGGGLTAGPPAAVMSWLTGHGR
jgi:hypothetical protein